MQLGRVVPYATGEPQLPLYWVPLTLCKGGNIAVLLMIFLMHIVNLGLQVISFYGFIFVAGLSLITTFAIFAFWERHRRGRAVRTG